MVCKKKTKKKKKKQEKTEYYIPDSAKPITVSPKDTVQG